MRVLIISDFLLRNDNGVGNSYNNIFSGIDGIQFANICCQEGKSKNNISSYCLQTSEKRILFSRFNKKTSPWIVEKSNKEYDSESIEINKNLFVQFTKKLKRSRLQIFFWVRNLIWKIGKWKTKELSDFVKSFNPDIIFAQVQDKLYLNNIISFVCEETGKPLILYVWDDIYSLKQFSLSPLFWVDRIIQRKSIKKLVNKYAKFLYTISYEQKIEYKKYFKIDTDILYKGYDFSNEPSKKDLNFPINILYAGNLYSGRYKTLKLVCEILEEYNKDSIQAKLDIYSATNLSKKQISDLNKYKGISFKGKTSEENVRILQNKADILLHIEPMTLKGSLICRLSFSTKLVDYFLEKKCIFAVGPERCSSIKYLINNDAAIVAKNYEEVREKFKNMIESKETIEKYASKSWECGKKNHCISDIQYGLCKKLMEIIK